MVDACRLFSATTPSLKFAAFVLGVALLLHVIGFSTNYWNLERAFGVKIHNGLWQHCYCVVIYGPETCVCLSWHGMEPGWFRGVQAASALALIAMILAVVLVAVQLFISTNRDIKPWTIACVIAAGLLVLIGVTVYGVIQRRAFHFSYVLCVIAAILCFLATPFLVKDRNTVLRIQQTAPVAHYSNTGHVINAANTDVITYTNQQPGYNMAYQPGAHMQYGHPPPYPVVVQQPYYPGNPAVLDQDRKM